MFVVTLQTVGGNMSNILEEVHLNIGAIIFSH